MIKRDKSELSDTDVFVNVRISRNLADKLDKYKEKRGTNRSIEVTRAIEFFVNSLECPVCGAINNGNGVLCSCCGAKLINFKELYAEFIEIFVKTEKVSNEIIKMGDDYLDTLDKIRWLVNKYDKDSDMAITSLITPLFDYCIDSIHNTSRKVRGLFEKLLTTTNTIETLADEFLNGGYVQSNISIDELKTHIETTTRLYYNLLDIRDNYDLHPILDALEKEVDFMHSNLITKQSSPPQS